MIFFTFFSTFSFGQNLLLKLLSKNEKELKILQELDYLKTHKTEKSVYLEANRIADYLIEDGFFLSIVDSIVKTDSLYIANFSLNQKIRNAVLKITNGLRLIPEKYILKNDSLYISTNEISDLLKSVSAKLDDGGKLFSEVQLKNIRVVNNLLLADLSIQESNKRKIDKIIIKPYQDFPKSFLKQYLKINESTLFNKKKTLKISEATKNLIFASEIKKPEVLFTRDSTLLYLYIKKEQNNSFDGLINFASTENGGFLFNGHLDLKLNNVLNTGESFALFWNSIADEVQDFKIETAIPFIFSSPFSTNLAFNIYKQDSTFLNTKFRNEILYTLNSKSNLFVSYSSENSNALNNTTQEVLNFDKNLFGLGFNYKIGNENKFFENTFQIGISAETGNRKTENIKTNQIELNFNTSYLWQINYRNSIYLKNESALLNSDNYLNNELFRIGGANSIRGFNEQSIYATKYTFFNTEYRYLTSETSYLFSITDFGTYYNTTTENSFILGFGLGYTFKTGNNTFKLSYALGKNQDENIYINQSKVIVNWTTQF